MKYNKNKLSTLLITGETKENIQPEDTLLIFLRLFVLTVFLVFLRILVRQWNLKTINETKLNSYKTMIQRDISTLSE